MLINLFREMIESMTHFDAAQVTVRLFFERVSDLPHSVIGSYDRSGDQQSDIGTEIAEISEDYESEYVNNAIRWV